MCLLVVRLEREDSINKIQQKKHFKELLKLKKLGSNIIALECKRQLELQTLKVKIGISFIFFLKFINFL